METDAKLVLSKFLESNSKIGFKTSGLIVVGKEFRASTKFGITAKASDIRKRKFEHNPKTIVKSEPIFIYDRNLNLQLILSDDDIPYRDGWVPEKSKGSLKLSFEAIANDPRVALIENEGRAVTKIDGRYVEFIIRNIEDTFDSSGSFKLVKAEGSEYDLLEDVLVGYTQASVTLEQALKAILQRTNWEVGQVDRVGSMSVDLRYMTVKQALEELLNLYGCEAMYRVEMKGNRVVKRYVDVFKQRGERTGKRFEVGKDIISTNRVLNSNDINTALYGFGASQEDDKPRLTFADVEWKIENGDPVDKPLGQNYVGDPDALEKWGREGGKRHKFGIYTGQEEDPATLLLNTWRELQTQIALNETYDIAVQQLGDLLGLDYEKISVGDSAHAINRRIYPEMVVEHRIVEYRHNLNDKRLSEVTLGDFRSVHDLSSRVDSVYREVDDNIGSLKKKPNKSDVKSEVDKAIDEAQERIDQAKEELEEAMENIEIGKENIIGLDDDLKDLDYAIENKIPIGHAAEDINESNTKVLGKNLVVDGDTTVTGNIGAPGAVFYNVGTENMVAKNATIEHGVITGVFDAPSARIKKATFEEVIITDSTISADGTFTGDLIGARVYSAETTFVGTDLQVTDNIYLGNSGDDSQKKIVFSNATSITGNFGTYAKDIELKADNTVFSKGQYGSQVAFIGSSVSGNYGLFWDSVARLDPRTRIYEESSDKRLKLETRSGSGGSIWIDPNGNIYFRYNGENQHVLYSNGDFWHRGKQES